MPKKEGAGGKLQEYDSVSGRYGDSQTNTPIMKKTGLLGEDVDDGVMRKEYLTKTSESGKVRESYLAKATDLLNSETDPNIKQRLTEYIADLNAEEGISNDMTQLAENIGTELLGFEFRIKNANSSRFMEKLRKNPTSRNGDNVRYTVKLEDDSIAVYHKTVEELKNRGYKQVCVKNYWNKENPAYEENPYSGINTNWQSQDGTVFEIQYHSKHNLEVKERLHKPYEQQRKYTPDTSEFEHWRLEGFKIAKDFNRPKGIMEVKDL